MPKSKHDKQYLKAKHYVKHGDIDKLKALDKDFILEHKKSLLCIASQYNQAFVVKFFIEELNINPSKCRYKGQTALLHAVNNNHQILTDYLIANGSNVNDETNSSGMNALLTTIYNGDTDLARHLLDHHKASIKVTDDEGDGILYYAFCFANSNNDNFKFAKELMVKHSLKPFHMQPNHKFPIEGLETPENSSMTTLDKCQVMLHQVPQLKSLLEHATVRSDRSKAAKTYAMEYLSQVDTKHCVDASVDNGKQVDINLI